MPKYKVWVHYDTGIEVEVEAADKDEAVEKAETAAEDLSEKEFMRQIKESLQQGEAGIIG